MSYKTTGIDVFPEKLDDPTTPWCSHGPALLFKRCNSSKGSAKRFYACGACRDRKQCSFFQWEEDSKSKKALAEKSTLYKQNQQKFTSECLNKRKNAFTCLPQKERYFCVNCGLLLLANEREEHKEHTVNNLEDEDILQTPTFLLSPLENNRSNAQYFFSKKTADFVLNSIKELGYERVICIGTPRLHELILQQQKSLKLQSLLLDIDYRLAQFFSPNSFCYYNMFNHHFFGGDKSIKTYKEYLQSSGKLLLLIDPPFGGLIKILAHTLKCINRDIEETGSSCTSVPFLLFLPYFMEPKVLEHMPDTSMLDYKVNYENHRYFHSERVTAGKKGSPVRIFTNISLNTFTLPADEGYRYCKICKYWVASENKHCKLCKKCPSKDGRTYKHCTSCERCVKPSYSHCTTCDRCHLPEHTCEHTKTTGCFDCGDPSHRKRDCPNSNERPSKRRKKTKKR